MKNFTTIVSIIASIVLIATCFAGCSSASTQPTATAILYQNTKNVSVPNINEISLKDDLIEDMKVDKSSASVFILDGQPHSVSNKIVASIPYGISSRNKTTHATQYANDIVETLNEATPSTPEVDYLYGITACNNYLNDSVGKKKLVIIGNALSTKGVINFVEYGLYFDIDAYIDYLKAENQLPSMQGVKVEFYIASACGDQEQLENKDISFVKDFYTKLFDACGTSVSFHEINMANDPQDTSSFPNVSTVDVRHNDFKAKPNNINITLEEDTTFISNSCELVDASKTEECLAGLVDTINQSSCKTLIFGSTAYTESADSVHFNFAMKRAKVIYDRLIALGANKNKLEYYSLGKANHDYRTKDDSGILNTEANHASNRIVMLVSEQTEKGEYLKNFALKYSVNKK